MEGHSCLMLLFHENVVHYLCYVVVILCAYGVLLYKGEDGALWCENGAILYEDGALWCKDGAILYEDVLFYVTFFYAKVVVLYDIAFLCGGFLKSACVISSNLDLIPSLL